MKTNKYIMNLKKLFESCKIGKMELKNRMVFPPISTLFARDGYVTKRMKNYYVERAKSGVGLMIIEDAIVDTPVGNHTLHPLAIDDDKFIPSLRDLAESIKREGAKVAQNLSHSGRRGGRVSPSGRLEVTRGMIPVAPSSLPHPVPGYVVPRELTVEEIHELVEKFGEGARRVKEAGFDAVHLHYAHMYLCNQFLSPFSNKRMDEYGRDFEGRLKFPLEVIRRIRQEVGRNYPIIVRMNGEERGLEGGLTLEDTKRIAQRFEEAGVDAIHISIGAGAALASRDFIAPVAPSRFPRGCIVHLAEAIKKGLHIPVIAANRINDPQFAEKILEEGRVDLVAMGRALIADPELPKKALEGRFDDINICIADNQCVKHVLELELEMVCTVNAAVGKEEEFRIKPTERRKKVMVAGGGPGGLEAARVTALKGHEVILYEEDDKLGGQALLSTIPPGKDEIQNMTNYFINQIKKLHVEIELGKKVTPEIVKKRKPDALIIATGAVPLIPKIPGIDKRNVVTAWQVLTGAVRTGEKVVVLGGGQVGAETAEFLAVNGKTVTIVEMLADIATDMDRISRTPLIFSLQDHDVTILTKTTAEEILENGVMVNRMGKKEMIKADTIVLALGAKPNNELAEKVKNMVPEIYCVGDCVKPRKMLEAIREGFEAAFKI